MTDLLLILLASGLVFVSFLLIRQRQAVIAAKTECSEQSEQLMKLQQSFDQLSDEMLHSRTLLDQANLRAAQMDQQVIDMDALTVELRERLRDSERVITNLPEQIALIERDSQQSKALFSTISYVAYDLVFVLDENLAVIALNKAADALFGTLHPIGEPLFDIIDSPDLADIIARAGSEDDSLEEQVVINRCYYRVRTQVMRYSDNESFVGVAMQDITQLVRLNRARRDMVANISHELRTPIANIRLIIDGLFHEQDRPKRKASIASLKDIARETDQLLRLVQELLDLSMIESGQAIMKLLPVRLLTVVEDTVDRLSDQLHQRHLTIAVHVPERIVVLCDYDQTRRVLTNLIRNAIKWSPQNDAITVSAAIEGEDVRISIFDNGPGVPENQRERIFERFYQVDTARSGGEGSGLGLAISKHIVEAHGGRIWAEGNNQGSGGRFMFTLLNATELEEENPMDRGQHDAILRPTPRGTTGQSDDTPGQSRSSIEIGRDNLYDEP